MHRVCIISQRTEDCRTDEGYHFLYLRLVARDGRYVEIRSTHLDDQRMKRLAREILNINSIDAALARVIAFAYSLWEDAIDIHLVAKIRKLKLDEIEMRLDAGLAVEDHR